MTGVKIKGEKSVGLRLGSWNSWALPGLFSWTFCARYLASGSAPIFSWRKIGRRYWKKFAATTGIWLRRGFSFKDRTVVWLAYILLGPLPSFSSSYLVAVLGYLKNTWFQFFWGKRALLVHRKVCHFYPSESSQEVPKCRDATPYFASRVLRSDVRTRWNRRILERRPQDGFSDLVKHAFELWGDSPVAQKRVLLLSLMAACSESFLSAADWSPWQPVGICPRLMHSTRQSHQRCVVFLGRFGRNAWVRDGSAIEEIGENERLNKESSLSLRMRLANFP